MRLLVTGATGFVGTHLIKHLNECGDEVAGIARRPAETSYELHLADLTDERRLNAVLTQFKPEGIIHLAGYADAGRSFKEPQLAWRDNLEATAALYRAIGSWGGEPRVLFVSSGAVYGNGPTAESAIPQPASPYAESKVAAEIESLQVYTRTQLPIIRVRPFNQVGPGQSLHYAASAFAEQVARIESNLAPAIIETGRLDVSRDLTDVRDMVIAYRLLLEKGTPGEVYNAASGNVVSMREVLDRLLQISGVQAEVRSAPARMRPGDIERLSASWDKLRIATGWSPRIPLEQSLRDILDGWRLRVRL